MTTPSTDAAVRFSRVSFRYQEQAAPALREVSFSVRPGEMVVVMGATGAGKSTLAKCLNRTVPAFQAGELTGEIEILGEVMLGQGVADLAGKVGLVSQDFEAQLFATNVVQEIAFGMEQLGVTSDDMRRRIPAALAAVGLEGFDGRDPSTLSGGEKQRLAIAATVALRPQLLVFDEPTTDLDPLGKLEIFAVLAAMRRQGDTLVVIEHETAAAELADRLIILSDGRVVADDEPARLLADVEFLEKYGVRPPDLSRVARRFELSAPLTSIEDAEARLRARYAFPARAEKVASSAAISTGSLGVPGAQAKSEPLIEAAGLDFYYDSGQQALRGVSLTIRAGEFIALIGQNGSGKTTLAKHLNGLLRPLAGQVRLAGEDVRELPLNRVAHDIGYVFQNPDHQIFAATVLDEVAFGPRNLGFVSGEVAQRVAEALDAVGLVGLEGEDPFLLSKGHRQRLAVASLLAQRPQLLILDEPTTGLDYFEQRRMMDLIARLHAQGMAILMITHSPWVVAEYAERGVLMREGRVLFDGPLLDLLLQEDLLASAHFRSPEVTRLGKRLGLAVGCVDDLAAEVAKLIPGK
ncbi:MAG: energy-coupling factor ABC transporter ATP-binding protein [Deltaproteobacteria bacterium]|nr:energy-coupling factor ABC transporter ATP-binding protein [Deltaproteobacteria bacterium]